MEDLVEFSGRVFESCLKSFLGLSSSLQQALFQNFNTGGSDSHKVRLWEYLLEFDSALHIDIEKRNPFCLLDALDLRFGRAVEIGVNFAVLNKLIFFDHSFKVFNGNEEIMLPVNFTFSRLPCGVGNAETKFVLEFFSDLVNQRSLAGTTRSHDN